MFESDKAEFKQFLADNGLIPPEELVFEEFVRVPTVHKPKKQNGVYLLAARGSGCIAWDGLARWIPFRGLGVVQRHAAERSAKVIDRPTFARKRAQEMLAEATIGIGFPYLRKKGFPRLPWQVWRGKVMLVPMATNDDPLVGMQMIDAAGGKKMMRGSKLLGSRFLLGGGSRNVFVEGLATGLSVLEAANMANIDARVVVTFCASNLTAVASVMKNGCVIADNDANMVGQSAAEASGLPWWTPPDVGMDANDMHTAGRLEEVAEAVQRLLS